MATSPALGEPRELKLSQGTVRYRERGSGPPLLFLHGVPENADGFQHVIPALAGEFRCIAPDWPWGVHDVPVRAATDLSPPGLADLCRDFLRELGVERATIVGGGVGGTIAQIFAATHPDPVERLVLLTGDALDHFPARSLGGFKLLTRSRAASWVFVQLARLRPVRRFWFGLSSRAAGRDDRLLRESYLPPMLTSAGVRRDIRQAIEGFEPNHSLIAAGALAVLEKPTLVIWSDDDRFFHLEDARRLAKLWPHARLEVLHHDRTFIAHDRPDQVVDLVRAWLTAGR